MGTTSQGSRQAKPAADPAESDSVAASISVLFRNRAPEHQCNDDLDDGWGNDEEGSSPSAVAVKLPADALAPARVPSFIAASLPDSTSEWPGAPLSRAPAVPEDEGDWDLPLPASAEATATSSCVRELAPNFSRASSEARADNGRSGKHEASSAYQVPSAPADSSAHDVLAGPESAVSAPAIDITIEPSFRGTTAKSKLDADSRSNADLAEVLSGPRSSRSAIARDIDRSAHEHVPWWLVAATVVVVAVCGTIFLAMRQTSLGWFKAQDAAVTAPIPLLPHLAIPNPPSLELPSPAAKPALEEATAGTGDSLESRRASRPENKPITRRRVKTVVSRPRPVEASTPIAVIPEPAAPSATAAPVGVVDLMIAAPAPKAAEPLQPAPTSRPAAIDEPQPSHPNK